MALPITDRSVPELLRSNCDNMLAFSQIFYAGPRTRVLEEQGLVLCRSEVAHPMFNLVLRTRLPEADALTRIDQTLGDYRRHGRSPVWLVWPHDQPANLGGLLKLAGMAKIGESPCMAMNLGALPPRQPIAGLQVAAVEHDADLDAFVAVLCASFGMPPDCQTEWKASHRAALAADSSLRLFIASLESHPVACAALFRSHDAAGVYNVGTVPGHRNKGIGRELTVRLLEEARTLGCGTAFLQSSPKGAAFYERIGFHSVGVRASYVVRRIVH